MHWADVIAGELLAKGGSHVINTGISPSGNIHVGNMREILTGDAVRRAVLHAAGQATLNYLADSADPLRKIPSYVPQEFSQYLGQSISRIPCPCGSHKSYAEHFAEPFLEVTAKLGIEMNVVYSHEMYERGEMADRIREAVKAQARIRQIITEISGREFEKEEYPYEPICPSCKRIYKGPCTFEDPYVLFTCSCGHQGKADIRKFEGKLAWRVEWPAKWATMGVTFEPFGKDHGAAGGSYHTGAAICREVFGKEPPHPLVYEWIQLKGVGAMSSSKGVGMSGHDMGRVVPPEVMRFLVMKPQPETHVDFDPVLGLIKLSDEFDKIERGYYGVEPHDPPDKKDDWNRTYELSIVGKPAPVIPYQLPFGHVVTLAQTSADDEGVMARVEAMKGSALTDSERRDVGRRLECARTWLSSGMAPAEVRFSILDEPKAAEEDRIIVQGVLAALSTTSWEPQTVNDAIFNHAKTAGLKPGAVFKAMYRTLLGKDRGPKLGMFLAGMDRERVLGLLEASLKR